MRGKEKFMKKRTLLLAAAAAAAMLLGACGSSAQETAQSSAAASSQAAESSSEAQSSEAEEASSEAASEAKTSTDGETTVTLAAAASLEYAFTEKIIPAFEAANPGIKIEGTYDSSGKLQTQIESGLAADIFFSAATKQMTALDEEGMVQSDTIKNLLENKIVMILPANSDKSASKFEDIVNFDTIAIGDPESVPAGQYAKEALTTLGLWDQVESKLSLGTNVTEVLNWVAEGSADAGIVYATDAATTDKVKVVAEAPEGSLAKPVLYPVAQMKATEEKDEATQKAAKAFYDYICSKDATDVLASYGFTVNE